MAEGSLSPVESLLAGVERGEVTPAQALAALSTAGGDGRFPATVALKATPAGGPERRRAGSLPPGPASRQGTQAAGTPSMSGAAPPQRAAARARGQPWEEARPQTAAGRSADAGALQELHSLVGLGEVKAVVQELHAFLAIQQRRRAAGLKCDAQALHMIFRGNPGTGKTTVARIVGRLLKEMGLLEKGHVVEVERADLVGEYIGHTAQRAREQVKKALGGVLFVDEAYSLARGGEKDFGKEAIDVLVKAMEDHRHQLVVILAGYRAEMEWFLAQNPGLHSRFPLHIDFPDYSVDELLEIARRMAADRDYRLSPEAERALEEWLASPAGRWQRERGNARLIRNVLERAARRQALRLARAPAAADADLMSITAEDLRAALPAAPAGLTPAPPRAAGGRTAWLPGSDGAARGNGSGGKGWQGEDDARPRPVSV